MGRTDRASRLIDATPAQVYAALVDPDALAAWLPPGGMTGRFEHFDARPRGSYRLILTYDDPDATAGKSSGGSDIVAARFLELSPGERVLQAVDFESDDPIYGGTMRMTWTVTAADGGALVEITAQDVPPGISAADHATGMASSLANLADYVER